MYFEWRPVLTIRVTLTTNPINGKEIFKIQIISHQFVVSFGQRYIKLVPPLSQNRITNYNAFYRWYVQVLRILDPYKCWTLIMYLNIFSQYQTNVAAPDSCWNIMRGQKAEICHYRRPCHIALNSAIFNTNLLFSSPYQAIYLTYFGKCSTFSSECVR